MFKAGQNPNYPRKGSQIKVEPIRDKRAITRIKKLLEDIPRENCIFTLGINTAFRANELLSIRAKQVHMIEHGSYLDIKQKKTKKYRKVVLNQAATDAIQQLLASRDYAPDDLLFQGQRGPITVPTVNRMVKEWCRNVGLKGNYGSHTLRKTWGYWQRKGNNAPVPVLMEAFGHATQKQTLDYLGIEEKEIHELYLYEI